MSVVTTCAGAYNFSRKIFLVESFGIIYFDSCNQNVHGDAYSCPFTADTFRPERDSAKTQTKLLCVVCIPPVNRVISIGKRLNGN